MMVTALAVTSAVSAIVALVGSAYMNIMKYEEPKSKKARRYALVGAVIACVAITVAGL